MRIGRALWNFILVYEVSLVLVLAFVGLGLLSQDWGEDVFRDTLGLVLVIAGCAWLLVALFLGGSNRSIADISTKTLLVTVPGKPPYVMGLDSAAAVRHRREEILARFDESIVAGVTGLTVLGLAALVSVNAWLALGVLLAEMAAFAYILAASRRVLPA